MRIASALRWPWLVIGSVPPVDSIRMSDQKMPVEILTDATWEIEMLSSVLLNQCRFKRLTRREFTTIRVGNRKLPFVHRLAENASSLEAGLEGVGVEEPTPIRARLFSRSRCSPRSRCRGRPASQ